MESVSRLDTTAWLIKWQRPGSYSVDPPGFFQRGYLQNNPEDSRSCYTLPGTRTGPEEDSSPCHSPNETNCPTGQIFGNPKERLSSISYSNSHLSRNRLPALYRNPIFPKHATISQFQQYCISLSLQRNSICLLLRVHDILYLFCHNNLSTETLGLSPLDPDGRGSNNGPRAISRCLRVLRLTDASTKILSSCSRFLVHSCTFWNDRLHGWICSVFVC